MKGVSIIIPAYNREKFIGQAIQSVLTQEYDGEVEIIIADDGSSDNTLQVAASFDNKKITILRKPEDCKTQGAAGSRNRGIKAATQPYICFLDSDDFFLPGHLKKMSAALESKAGLGFAFCRIIEMDEEKSSNLFRKWTKDHITANDILNPVISGNNVVCTNVFIFRRNVFDKVGGFNETYMNGEDGDMWMRISEQFKGTFSDHYGAVRRQHGLGQLTANPDRVVLKGFCELYKSAIKRYYQLSLNDPYRLLKLRLLVLKYKLSSIRGLHYFYPLYHKYINKSKIKAGDWYELSHFLRN